jgi:hypothetical protein
LSHSDPETAAVLWTALFLWLQDRTNPRKLFTLIRLHWTVQQKPL